MAEVSKERLSELLLSGALLKHLLTSSLCSFLMTFQATFRLSEVLVSKTQEEQFQVSRV